jgi:hypothetical protein
MIKLIKDRFLMINFNPIKSFIMKRMMICFRHHLITLMDNQTFLTTMKTNSRMQISNNLNYSSFTLKLNKCIKTIFKILFIKRKKIIKDIIPHKNNYFKITTINNRFKILFKNLIYLKVISSIQI